MVFNKIGKHFLAVFFIIIVAFLLRFYQLGQNPPSLDWDEASIGYNAYSILKTGADEYGNRLPLSFRSFDDYKPPLYIYLTVPSVAAFGLNEFSVRLPSAVMGVISVVVIYFLVLELLQKWEKNKREIIAFVSALFVAISPWSLQFSRAAFEGNTGLTFLLLGILLFFYGFKKGWMYILSSLAFVLSMYSYHSFRVVVPVILLCFLIFFRKELFKKLNFVLPSTILFLALVLPIVFSFVGSQGSGSRLSMVTVFSNSQETDLSAKRLSYDKSIGNKLGIIFDNRRVTYFLEVAKGYLDHFNPDFLFLHGDGGVQHHAVDMGMLYLWDLPFILLGLYFLIKNRDRQSIFIFLLVLIGPLPAAVTTGTPHPVRAIAMMSGLHILSAIGAVYFIFWCFRKKNVSRSLAMILVASALVFNFLYYLHQYYVHTPIEYGYYWQYGYKDVMSYLKTNEDFATHIIVTYKYDQPYIYYLFYNKIDPAWYQKNWDYNKNGKTDRFKRVIGKYEFRNINYSSDVLMPNTILVGTPQEIPDGKNVVKNIYFPDGRIAFRIAKTWEK